MPSLHTHITNHEMDRPSSHIRVFGDDYHITTMNENGRLDGTSTSIIKIFHTLGPPFAHLCKLKIDF